MIVQGGCKVTARDIDDQRVLASRQRAAQRGNAPAAIARAGLAQRQLAAGGNNEEMYAREAIRVEYGASRGSGRASPGCAT